MQLTALVQRHAYNMSTTIENVAVLTRLVDPVTHFDHTLKHIGEGRVNYTLVEVDVHLGN